MQQDPDAFPPAPGRKSTIGPVVLALSVFLNFIGFTLIIPVVPFLVGRYVPAGKIGLYVGLIVSVFALCAFVSAPVLGAASDRYGRRQVLILSLFGSALGYFVFGLGGAIWVLFAGRIIDGLTAGNISTVYAYVGDSFAPAERGRIYGLLGAVGGLGFMFGPVIGGFLGTISPDAPPFAAAALTLANIAWVYFALPETVKRGAEHSVFGWVQLNPMAQLAKAFAMPALRLPFAVSFCFFFAGTMLQSNFAVYLKNILKFGPEGIGGVLFVVGVMDIVSQGLLTGKLLPRFGAPALARSGLVINAAGFGLIGCLVLLPHIAFLLAAIVIFTLGDGLFQPAMNAIISASAPGSAQGLVQGANQSQQALARATGPLLAALLSALDASTVYWVGGLVVLLGAWLLTLVRRSMPPGGTQ